MSEKTTIGRKRDGARWLIPVLIITIFAVVAVLKLGPMLEQSSLPARPATNNISEPKAEPAELPKDDPIPEDPKIRVERLIEFGEEFVGGESKEAIIKRLGKPVNTKTEEYENPHVKGQMDEVRYIEYDGMTVATYYATGIAKEMLLYLAVSSPKYPMKWSLNVGNSKQKVLDVMGKPTKEEDGSLVYESDGWPHSVEFTIKDGTVVSVEWLYNID